MKPRKPPAPSVTEVRRCAIYTRKSKAVGVEEDFTSLDAQRDACVDYVRRQPGWELVDVAYDDSGFTGANVERPAFQRLMTDVEARTIDVVVVYKIDRLSRSLLDFVQMMEQFNEAGASFVSVTQNFSTANAMGRFTLNIMMSFAELEREMIAERTRDKIAGARRRGKWTGGIVPIGYTVVDKKLVVHELEAVLVREVFALYDEHRSVLAVVRALKARDRTTKRHRAANGRVREARAWGTNDVARVLKNPLYAGYTAYGGELFKAEHAPLVAPEDFARAQRILAGGAKTTQGRGRNPAYLLRGVLRCACCGSAFTPASTSKPAASDKPRGKVHRYYRCTTRDKHGKEACPSSPLPAAAIERYVVSQLREATFDGTLAAEIADAVRRRIAARRQDLAVERQQLPAQIVSLSTEARRLADAMAQLGGAAGRLIEQRLQAAAEQLARHESRLMTAERELTRLDAVEVEVSWVTQCLAEFDRVWDALTVGNQGRLVRAIVECVEVDQPANTFRVVLADLGAEVGAAATTGVGADAEPAANELASLEPVP